MTRIEVINSINKAVIDNDEKQLVDILSTIFDNNQYKEYLDVAFMAIKVSQMYGFLSYFSKKELEMYYSFDQLRSASYQGNKIDHYNKGQLSLKDEVCRNKKTFISAPTSFGKTRVVIDYIIEKHNSIPNILFIVPTNSLLEELYIYLLKINKELRMNYHISTQPTLTDSVRNILLLTPERFLLLAEKDNVSSFDLIVMDESYKIYDGDLDEKTNVVDTRSLRFRRVADMIGTTSKQLVMLSPYTYSKTDSMNAFLSKNSIKDIDRTQEYVKKNIFDVSTKTNCKKYFDNFNCDTYSSIPNKTVSLLKVLKNEKNIVYVSTYKSSYNITRLIEKSSSEVNDQRYNAFIKHLTSNYGVENKAEWELISALRKGTGIYLGPIPRYIKRELVRLFELGIINSLIVTTAFTEGVNTAASNLIITSLNTASNIKLSKLDILNTIGRAGRFAKKSVGNIYCIDKVIYETIMNYNENPDFNLINYNYSFEYRKKDPYEIDMMDDKYLNLTDISIKNKINEKIINLNLSKEDLNIALNVSNNWKVILYESFNSESIDKYYEWCINILETNEKSESIGKILKYINEVFAKTDTDAFNVKPYEIRPFDSKGNCIWERLYRIYSSGSASKVVARNIRYIESCFDDYCKGNVKSKCEAKQILEEVGYSWILKYYNDKLTIDINYAFIETFKFVSNIVQYKIPFYISFFSSIVKLYIKKSGLADKYDVSKINENKITFLFENGDVADEYSQLIDFGMSNDIITKMNNNNISVSNITENKYDRSLFDEYESYQISDFISLYKE